MAYDPTDAVMARGVLEDALALTSTPTLTTPQIDRAFALAAVEDDAGNVTYPVSALNEQAARLWRMKAGLTSDRYDMGGGAGVSLTESQWHAQCLGMARDFETGRASVVGSVRTGRGIGSVSLVTPAYTETGTV